MLIILVILVLLITMVYYLSRSVNIYQKVQLQPPSLPPIREVQVLLGDNIPKMIQVRTKKDLEDEIERVVDRATTTVDYNRQEIIEAEKRIIDAQKQKVEQLRLEAEEEAVAREAELTARKKRYDDMLKQKREEIIGKKRKMQEERAAKLLLERERERLNKEKRLAELKLARQKALQELEVVQKQQSDKEKKLKEEELQLLEAARQKVEEDKIKAEEDVVELQKKIEMEQTLAEANEAKFQREKNDVIEQQKKMEEEYKAKMVEQAFKVEEANAELDKLLVLEKARQIQMEEEDEQRREEERQKLLLANEAVLKELEEAEAEQARMDAEEAEARRQFELEATAAEDAQRAKSAGSQAEYDAKIAADQALLDKQITDSEKTGDTEQQAERRAALDLEAQSKRDASILSEEEQQRGREAAAKLAADSEAGGTVVEDEGEPLAFDYDAYMRGDPIPCTVKEWGVWKKVGGLSEETETITSGGRMKRTYERKTGRWKQAWKREREVVSPALNGGTCVTEESRYTSQASTNCEESDWNEWKNVGAPFQDRRGNKIKWFQKKERDRKTAVVPDGCNIRYDTMNTELSPENCKYSELSPWSNVGNAYEQTKKVARGRFSRVGGYNTVKTGKWVIKQEATRSIVEQAKYGGEACSDAGTKRTQEFVLDPVNCVQGRWGPWTAISDRVDRKCVSLGLRQGRSCTDTHYARDKRTRPVTVQPLYGGAGCGPSEEIRETKRDPIACAYSAWSAWRNTTGAVEQTKKRAKRRGGGYTTVKTGKWVIKQESTRSIAAQPKYGGSECRTTEATLKKTRENVLNPVNCGFSNWGGWVSRGGDHVDRKCVSLGLRQGRSCTDTHYARDKRTRPVTVQPLYGGAGCGPSEEIRETKRDPIACAYSAWSAWRNTTGAVEQTKKRAKRRGGGYTTVKTGKWVIKQESTRSIAAQPKYGGSECRTTEATLKKTRENVLNPVNCGFSNWGGWVSRGGDHVDRKCVSLGLRRGRSCTDTHYQLLKRNRFITRHPAYGGNGCPHLEEHKNVERPKINCLMSWGGWQNNGRGKKVCTGRRPRRCRTVQPQIRYATITRPAAYGGSCGSTTQKR